MLSDDGCARTRHYLIDRINPFGEAYAILAKTMSEESLKQLAAAISAKRVTLTPL